MKENIVRRGEGNMMDYAKTASLVIKYVGGKDNIKSVTIVPPGFVFSSGTTGCGTKRQSATWKG